MSKTDAGRPERRGSVLVVDHEEAVAELQRLYLTRAGFEVVVEHDPPQAVTAVQRVRPGVVVLDLSVPGIDADALHREVVAAAAPAPVVPVVPAGGADGVLAAGDRGGGSSNGGGGARRASGDGGVSAVTRPFSPRVLVSAVREAVRRSAGESSPPHVLTTPFLAVDPVTRTVRAAGRDVELTATEFDLLVFMMRHPGRVYTREQLLATVWPTPSGAGSRTVDVHIAQLRAKLGGESPIRTVRGVGYAADAPAR